MVGRSGWTVLAGALAIATLAHVQVAHACGGFFCGSAPVDQTAERIAFRVNETSTSMIVQISYTGQSDEFAWVLPLADVPDAKSLKVFPQRALTALDANTGPRFERPSECPVPDTSDDCNICQSIPRTGGVTVHYRETVGPYDVAAIESTDPMALFTWLRDNHFNVGDVMLPYIETYTKEGMKFLAAKLQNDKSTSDIQPLQFDLPGTSPSIPLRMTALAAEPEMSVLAFVFGAARYNGANWPDVEIADDHIVWWGSDPIVTNWSALVARGVDEAGGQGWVTELAGPTEPLLQLLDATMSSTPEDMAAAAALHELIDGASYVTRLYSRLSAEEMTIDPIFHRTKGGDVSRDHALSRYVDGVDQCPDVPVSDDPCVFTSCGAGGACVPVLRDGSSTPLAGCACIDGTSARTTYDPASLSPYAYTGAGPAATVVCQDLRMSFVNPGDKTAAGVVLQDPCASFDCGAHGDCVAVNMTPTCICDHGYAATGSFPDYGTRETHCEKPMMEMPESFYARRLPDLPDDLPGGHTAKVYVKPKPDAGMDDDAGDDRSDGRHSRPRSDAGIDVYPSPSHDDCSVSIASAGRDGRGHAFIIALAWLIRARSRRGRAPHRDVTSSNPSRRI